MVPIINDPILGSMENDGHYYNGSTTIDGSAVDFSIGTYQVEDVACRIEYARQILPSMRFLLERAKRYAAEKLLPLKNDSWEEEDGRTIDEREFVQRISVVSITLDHDGEWVIYFGDGDLFYGHHILVTQRRSGELDRAEIQG